jgi:indole-3-glycerol phosphate synthase
MYKGVTIIAEVKTGSPFGFKSQKSWDELFAIADKCGDVISIHTDARWNGSFDLIAKARSLTKKPILAKGIHEKDEDIEKAISAGADYVLVVGRVPGMRLDRIFVEPKELNDLKDIPGHAKLVWNSRDLITGNKKIESFEEARKMWKGWICQASYIKTVSDIKDGTNAVLVGEHLEEFYNSMNI